MVKLINSSKHSPRISVLIGCWNNATTVQRAIDSILNQTITDLELIVVDDGSTDHTPELVANIEDARLRYLQLPHQGISGSLNAGIQAARAPVVAIQDADDWSLPERLERQLAVLEARMEVAVVGTRMREVDEAGNQLRPRTKFKTGDLGSALLHFNPIANSCVAFRRDVIQQLGGFDCRYRYAMDYDLWLRVADQHVVTTLPDRLAVRQMGTANVAARKERAQTWEAVKMRMATLQRRRSLRGVSGLALPALSLVVPLSVKRQLRRVLGQAP